MISHLDQFWTSEEKSWPVLQREMAGGLLESERRVYAETTARNTLPGPAFPGTMHLGKCRSWRFGETRRPFLQKVYLHSFHGENHRYC